MILETVMNAFVELMQVQHLLYLFGGVLLGVIVGILPGLGGIVGFSIMLPFLYGMDVTSALAMLIGMVAVVPTSDTFTSVLMGIPGSSASQATVLDGYPMTKKGQAARALGAAFTSSLFGGILGAFILSIFVVFSKDLILSLGSAELFILGIFGLSMVGVLSGKSLYKGFMAAAVGLLIGSIGSAPATGEFRMTMDSYYLYDGIKLVILGLGVYAIPEIISLLIENKRISKAEKLSGSFWQGIKDVWMYKWIVARCAPIGAAIGAIPGLGGSVVDWIAYGHVVQTEKKDKSNFGKGDVRGVIAPESANNAKEGGGLIPTLLLGIPGSGSMAIFLGGLVILGVEPGPSMVNENLDITYTIIWSLALANIVGTAVCILLANQVSKVTAIPYGYLAPIMFMVIFFAALQATRSLEDLILLISIGALGVLFKYFDWPRPALLIGFILSPTIETYYYQAVQFYSWEMLQRPGVIGLIIFIVLSVGISVHFKNKEASKYEEEHQNESEESRYSFITGEVLFTWLLMIGGAYALLDSTYHEFLGGIFPMIISSLLLIFGVVLTFQFTSKKRQASTLNVELTKNGEIDPLWKSTWLNFLILPVFLFGVWIFGFVASLFVLFFVIIRVKTASSWLKIAIITICSIAFLLFISDVMTLHLPTGLIYDTFIQKN